MTFFSLVLSSPIAKNASFIAFDDEQSLNINDKPPVAAANLSTAESAESVIAIECTVTSAANAYIIQDLTCNMISHISTSGNSTLL